jgi:hypothetical protein
LCASALGTCKGAKFIGSPLRWLGTCGDVDKGVENDKDTAASSVKERNMMDGDMVVGGRVGEGTRRRL